jgi:very-long-chain (3R)-3-hydroxyacyl-CoA dehydratase
MNLLQGRQSVFFSLMVFCWSVTEIIRYLYFALLNPLVMGKQTPDMLTFLRYSTFLVLYPAGVAGEVGVIYSSLNAVPTTISYIFMAIMVVYIPGTALLLSPSLSLLPCSQKKIPQN